MTNPEDTQTLADALEIMNRLRVAVLVVAYNAERHIAGVLRRIHPEIAARLAEIYLIDDSSQDQTCQAALAAGAELGLKNLKVCRTPVNRGYGGNQKLGYLYAIQNNFDVVIMLHGDGQYPPEQLPHMIAPFSDQETEVVLGSRMLKRFDALRGRMPFYKWVGNQALTWIENKLLKVKLAEFHTGYRAYRVDSLRRMPFTHNSDGFHFDTQILIQFISKGGGIREIPIPTHYGDEVCHVPGFRYAWECVKAVIKYRLFKMGLFYNPFLDFNLFDTERFYLKQAENSLHQFVLNRPEASGKNILCLGDIGGYFSEALAKKATRLVAVCPAPPRRSPISAEVVSADPLNALEKMTDRFDTVVIVDALERLDQPERMLTSLAERLEAKGKLIISAGNLGFFVLRVLLLFGHLNYSKYGILSLSHRRLYTRYSLQQLCDNYGYTVESVTGFGPPIRDLISQKWPYSWLDSTLGWLARLWPSLFAYNLCLVARRKPRIPELYAGTFGESAIPPKVD